MTSQDRQLAAVMFADIVGYTAMMSENESRTLEIMDSVRSHLKELVDQFGGRWLKELGDGFLMSFSSASNSVRCALEIQKFMADIDAQLRIGIHSGEIIFRNDDIYGDGVNIAARLQQLTNPGGIFISGRLYEDISNKSEFTAVKVGSKKLKNIDREIGIYAITSQFVHLPKEYRYEGWTSRKRLTTAAIFFGLLITVVVVVTTFVSGVSKTSTVTVTDEEGNTIAKEIAQTEYIKKLIFFPFENKSTPDNQWLEFGTSYLLASDITQDIFTSVRMANNYAEDLREAGVTDFSNIPEGIIRKVAREYRYDYYVVGDFELENDVYKVTSRVYDTETSGLVSEVTSEGSDLFALSDQMTREIRLDLGISEVHISGTEDRKISEILTPSIEALKYYSIGAQDYSYKNDSRSALNNFIMAVEKDPEFAYAYFQTAGLFIMLNQFSSAREYISKALEYSYRLTERDEFATKSVYYFLNEEKEKRKRLLNVWKDLYPEDIDAYYNLGLIHYFEGDGDKAIEVFKEALQFDDYRGNILIYMSRIYSSRKQYDEALKYIQRFADKYPNNPRSYSLMGEFYLAQGDFDNAKNNYEQASLMDQTNMESKASLAFIDVTKGDFETGMNEYKNLLKTARTAGDSLIVQQFIRDYYFYRGEYFNGIKEHEFFLKIYSRVAPEIQVSIVRVTRLAEYFEIGLFEEGMEIIREAEKQLADSFSDIPAYGYCNYYIARGDIQNAEKAYSRIMDYNQKYGSPSKVELIYEGEIHILKGEYQEAIEAFQEFKLSNVYVPTSYVNEFIADCYFNLKDFEKAKESLNETLNASPFDGECNLRMAEILIEEGKEDEATAFIEKAAKTFENGDIEYRPVKRLRELQGQSSS